MRPRPLRPDEEVHHGHRRVTRQYLIAPHGFEHFARVSAQLFLDRRERCGLAGALVFDRGADHAAGIGDKVGDTEDSALREDFFRRVDNRC